MAGSKVSSVTKTFDSAYFPLKADHIKILMKFYTKFDTQLRNQLQKIVVLNAQKAPCHPKLDDLAVREKMRRSCAEPWRTISATSVSHKRHDFILKDDIKTHSGP